MDKLPDLRNPDVIRAWLSARRGRKTAVAHLCGVTKGSVQGWWYRGAIPDRHLDLILRTLKDL